MRNLTTKQPLVVLVLPLLLTALPGCSGQPSASTTDNQQAREKEAQEKMKSALQSDPTLQPPGTGNGHTPASGMSMSPGPIPGASGSSPSPGPVPGGR